jgi:large subunit ribosomal protein L11
MVLPALITIYDDRSFEFVIKSPPVSVLLKKACGLAKGSGDVPRTKVGKVTRAQMEAIAKDKMEDLNALDIQAAVKMVAGTARSMGIETE